jgi:hypothetical protein
VVQEGAALLDFAVHLDEVFVVDARDQHRIDLGEHAARGAQCGLRHIEHCPQMGTPVALCSQDRAASASIAVGQCTDEQSVHQGKRCRRRR